MKGNLGPVWKGGGGQGGQRLTGWPQQGNPGEALPALAFPKALRKAGALRFTPRLASESGGGQLLAGGHSGCVQASGNKDKH